MSSPSSLMAAVRMEARPDSDQGEDGRRDHLTSVHTRLLASTTARSNEARAGEQSSRAAPPPPGNGSWPRPKLGSGPSRCDKRRPRHCRVVREERVRELWTRRPKTAWALCLSVFFRALKRFEVGGKSSRRAEDERDGSMGLCKASPCPDLRRLPQAPQRGSYRAHRL